MVMEAPGLPPCQVGGKGGPSQGTKGRKVGGGVWEAKDVGQVDDHTPMVRGPARPVSVTGRGSEGSGGWRQHF